MSACMRHYRATTRSLVRIIGAALLVGSGLSCSEDPPTGPRIDVVIKVRDTTFIPSNVTIEVGQRVEWQNWSRDERTVTSGVGPEDADAGELLDVSLDGYPNGEAIGGRLQRQFTEPDTFYYFSREVPPGYTGDFLGVIIVTS